MGIGTGPNYELRAVKAIDEQTIAPVIVNRLIYLRGLDTLRSAQTRP